MYCINCGKQVEKNVNYCPYCGSVFNHNEKDVEQSEMELKNASSVLYHLPIGTHRLCDIQVFHDRVTFTGKFWYLRDKDFYGNHGKDEIAYIKDFLGIGYLTKRSYRQTVLFVFAGTFLELVKAGIDKLGEWVDNVNSYLQWIGCTISLPEWMDITVHAIAMVCAFIALSLFFSKKKVIEISFTTKRICIPQKSLSTDEFYKLREIIKLQKG